jgi:hypothetical protein
MGKVKKREKQTRVNVVHEDKCKPTPKDVGGEGTSYQEVRPRLPRVRDYDNLKKKYLRNLLSFEDKDTHKYGMSKTMLSSCVEMRA